MADSKHKKEEDELGDELNASLRRMGAVIVTRNLGMTIAQSTDLRQKMRDAGASYKVTRNRLTKIAIQGTDYAGIADMLTGPVGLATSVDPVTAAKVAIEFAKSNDRLEIVGGAMGTQVLNAEGIKVLASLPSLDELRAKLVGLIQAPARNLTRCLAFPAEQLSRDEEADHPEETERFVIDQQDEANIIVAFLELAKSKSVKIDSPTAYLSYMKNSADWIARV